MYSQENKDMAHEVDTIFINEDRKRDPRYAAMIKTKTY